MKKKILFSLISFLIIILIGGGIFYYLTKIQSKVSQPESLPEKTATLNIVSGQVLIKTTETENWQTATDGLILKQSDWVKTEKNTKATITFFDGSIVRLDENTEIVIKKMQQQNEDVNISLKITIGRLWAKVKKLFSKDSSFDVETPATVATVRGTAFLVSVSEIKGIDVLTFEDEVEVFLIENPKIRRSIRAGKKISLSPILLAAPREIKELKIASISEEEMKDEFVTWNKEEDKKMKGMEEVSETEEIKKPEIVRISPSQIKEKTAVKLYIYGKHFLNNSKVSILNRTTTGITNKINLRILSIKNDLIICFVPDNLPIGFYTVIVENPGSQITELANAFEIVKAEEETDKKAREEEKYIDLLFSQAFLSPNSIILGERIKIGAEIKNNGNQTATNVLVVLYLGNPNEGGKLLKSQTISSIGAGYSIKLSDYSYTPTAVGTFYLYFIIDPRKTISESNETNNLVIRKLIVAQPAVQPGPQITRAWLTDQVGNEFSNFYPGQTVRCNFDYQNLTSNTIIKVKFFTSNGNFVTENSAVFSGSGTGYIDSPPDFFEVGDYFAKIYINDNYTGFSLSFSVISGGY